MPITNNASYVPTMNDFLAHWAFVDAALPAPFVVNAGGGAAVNRAAFVQRRADLVAANAAVIDRLNDQQIARGGINLQKEKMLGWLREFTGLVNAYYQGTPFLNAVPKVPSISEGQEVFGAPLVDAASLWTKLNAGDAPAGIALPLVLSDGTVQADFQAGLAQLGADYTAEADARQSVTLARASRDQLKAHAYAIMKNYRQALPSRCAQHPDLVESMPGLTPAGGHTPDPVNASAVFQAPDQAHVTYDASTDAALARYELRGNPGDDYNEDDAVVIEAHEPADPREFTTGFGLNQPGAQVALKVYVVLTTGNEAGSAAMVVARPG